MCLKLHICSGHMETMPHYSCGHLTTVTSQQAKERLKAYNEMLDQRRAESNRTRIIRERNLERQVTKIGVWRAYTRWQRCGTRCFVSCGPHCYHPLCDSGAVENMGRT